MNYTETPVAYLPSNTRWVEAVPEVGQLILVNNAGGYHQNPGSYGYTLTKILAVEQNGNATRIETDAFGMGCWTINKRVKAVAH